MPAVDGQDAQDEEIQDENECLRQRRHKEMNPSRGPINHITVQVGPKSTLSKALWMNRQQIRALLDDVRGGSLTPEAAQEQLLQFLSQTPFEDLGFARVDHQRNSRQGFPEVVFGQGKTPDQIAAIADRIVGAGHSLLVTRTDRRGLRRPSSTACRKLSITSWPAVSRSICRNAQTPRGRGTILIAAAGTADLPVAEEAAVTAEVMGNTVDRLYDVGVAGPAPAAEANTPA